MLTIQKLIFLRQSHHIPLRIADILLDVDGQWSLTPRQVGTAGKRLEQKHVIS
jgi:hypothetical protein